MPLLNISVGTKPIPLSATAQRSVQALDRYDWILFTSKNAVAYFLKAHGSRPISLAAASRVAAVGPETADALRKVGISMSIVPQNPTVDAMIEELGIIRGSRILFPRSAIAPQNAIRTLRKKGAIVRVIPLYTTIPVLLSRKTKDELLSGAYTALSFSSPSGVHSLLSQLSRSEREYVFSIPAQCIGPTTLAAAKLAGFSSARTLRS